MSTDADTLVQNHPSSGDTSGWTLFFDDIVWMIDEYSFYKSPLAESYQADKQGDEP